MPVKAIFIPRSRLHGPEAMQLRKARRMAGKQPGYTKTEDVIFHPRSIEFPQTKVVTGGPTRFVKGGAIVQY